MDSSSSPPIHHIPSSPLSFTARIRNMTTNRSLSRLGLTFFIVILVIMSNDVSMDGLLGYSLGTNTKHTLPYGGYSIFRSITSLSSDTTTSSSSSCQARLQYILLEEFPQPFKEVHQFLIAGIQQLGFNIRYMKRDECFKASNTSLVEPPCLSSNTVTLTTTMCIVASSIPWPRYPLFINLEVLNPQMQSWPRPCLEPGYRNIVWNSGPVWDYSYNNIQYIQKQNIPNQVQYLPLRYYPGLVMVTPETKYSERNDKDRETDVVFIGNWDQSPRRKIILDQLRNKGLKIEVLTHSFNHTRDERVIKAKIALNVRFYVHNYETVRLFWLLSLGSFIVNEADPVLNKESIEEYKETVVHAPYDQLVDTVLKYLPLVEERNRIADNGYRMIRSQTAGEVMYNLLKDASIPGLGSCVLDPPSKAVDTDPKG